MRSRLILTNWAFDTGYCLVCGQNYADLKMQLGKWLLSWCNFWRIRLMRLELFLRRQLWCFFNIWLKLDMYFYFVPTYMYYTNYSECRCEVISVNNFCEHCSIWRFLSLYIFAVQKNSRLTFLFIFLRD